MIPGAINFNYFRQCSTFCPVFARHLRLSSIALFNSRLPDVCVYARLHYILKSSPVVAVSRAGVTIAMDQSHPLPIDRGVE